MLCCRRWLLFFFLCGPRDHTHTYSGPHTHTTHTRAPTLSHRPCPGLCATTAATPSKRYLKKKRKEIGGGVGPSRRRPWTPPRASLPLNPITHILIAFFLSLSLCSPKSPPTPTPAAGPGTPASTVGATLTATPSKPTTRASPSTTSTPRARRSRGATRRAAFTGMARAAAPRGARLAARAPPTHQPLPAWNSWRPGRPGRAPRAA